MGASRIHSIMAEMSLVGHEISVATRRNWESRSEGFPGVDISGAPDWRMILLKSPELSGSNV